MIPWANFMRAKDHGIGSFFYIVIGFLALLFTILTAITFGFDRSARRSAGLPAYTAVLLAISYAVITWVILVPAAFQLGNKWQQRRSAEHILEHGAMVGSERHPARPSRSASACGRSP